MENGNKVFLIGKTVIICYLLTIIQIFIYSFVLANTSISENTIPTCVFIFSILSVFLSSSFLCIKIKERGMKYGGFVGLFYILTVYVLGSIISGNFSLTTYSIVTIIFNILLGMIGGIIGVNMAR